MFDYADMIREKVDRFNAEIGMLNVDRTDTDGNLVRGDGISCALCKNKGVVMVLEERDGRLYDAIKVCECGKARANVNRLRSSGLEKAVTKYSFANFDATEDWQKKMVALVKDYVVNGAKAGKWLYVGGQTGAGKTHICVAAVGRLIDDFDVQYIIWPHTARKLKALTMDAERYAGEIEKIQNAGLLYIDDYQKPVFNGNGSEAVATSADVRLAYEILNYRYVNELPTIISSEWFSHELAQIDEATAGRIAESCGKYKLDIGRNVKRNHRLSGNVI